MNLLCVKASPKINKGLDACIPSSRESFLREQTIGNPYFHWSTPNK